MYHITPVIELLENCGYEISYMWEDLIFTQHNTFLVQLDTPSKKQVFIYFNQDCESKEKETITKKLSNMAHLVKMKVIIKGTYSLKENQKEEEISLEFTDNL